ncbi:MAG: hypothetical protein H6534_01670 [Chthonomonadaceae bacterium]|nr:hypothetical protein [Chthonomonadaceae bacterium]
MRLRALEVYGLVTLQGPPQSGRRKFGIAPGGAFDRESAALANVLMGNGEDAVVIELGLGTLVMDAPDGGALAVVGAECRVEVDGKERAAQSAMHLRAGAYVEVGIRAIGARVYVAVPGGFLSAGLGAGERISTRRVLSSAEERTPVECRLAEGPGSLDTRVIRVLPGPRLDRVPNLRLEGEWRVRPQSDRVGVRLDGESQPHGTELPSEPMCVGAVQATPKGGLLVLGPDGPTIGGYPHVATVIDADLDKVAQLRPRDQVRLKRVTLEEAQQARRAARSKRDQILAQLALRAGE